MGELIKFPEPLELASSEEDTKIDEYLAGLIEKNKKIKRRLEEERKQANQRLKNRWRLNK